MDLEMQYLLHLLGAYINKEKPEILPDADWGKLMDLARIHNLSGVLGYMAMRWPICPAPELRSSLRSLCLSTMAVCAKRKVLAEQLSEFLAQERIDHLFLKGYILRELFPVPELRTFGDIDLVIRPEDRTRCHEKMLEWGYAVKADWEPVYSYTRGDEYYEIHTQIMEVDVSERADYRGYFQQLWDHAVPMGAFRWQLAPEYHFLYMLTHIAKHVVGSGAGIRMYLDVAVFAQHHARSLAWDWVRAELKAMELTGFANTVLTLVEENLGVPSPIGLYPLEEETKAEFLELTMRGGIFGRSGQDSGINSLKQNVRSGKEISRTGTLVRRLFPAAQSIQSRYTYLQDKPWLLPAAWVHRLVKTRDGWASHTLEAKNILAADKEEAKRLNRLYRDIGL